MADITLSSLIGGNLTLTGDVTGTGASPLAVTIAAGAVTLAKMANLSTASFIGRNTAGTGVPEALSIATVKTMLNLTGTNSGDQTTITGNAGSATVLQTARTINGVSFNGSANITIVDATKVSLTGNETIAGAKTFTDDAVFGVINAASIYQNGELLWDQSNLAQFGAANFGYVPQSGGGTTNFLRADGTWAAPAGGGGGAWGSITGTLSSQTDLNTALGLKANLTGATFTGDVTTNRTAAPTTGYLYFGNSNARYIGWDGTNFVINPVAGQYNILHTGNFDPALKANLASPAFTGSVTATSLTMLREDAVSEGGAIQFSRPSDNAVSWSIDVQGTAATPSLRILSSHGIAGSVALTLNGVTGAANFFSTLASVGSGDPGAPAGYAMTVSGTYGGGYRLIDGAGHVGFSTNASGANLNIGFGSSASVPTKFTFTSGGNLTATGRVFAAAHFNSTSVNVVLGGTGTGGIVYLRPNGADNSASEMQIQTSGVTWSGNSLWHTGNDTTLMKYRGVVTSANLNTATGSGFYIDDGTSATFSMLTWNTGSSTGPVQLHVHYDGTMKFRNQTDSTTWTGWKKLWHDGNDGAGSGLDADLLDGMNASNAAGGSTIVARNPSGYIYANYFNCTADVTSTSPTQVAIFTGNDNFIRQQTLANFRINSAALNGATSAVTMDEGVAKWMRWKNYGAGHVIFDASQGTSPSGSALTSNTNPDAAWAGSYPTLMGWNGSSTYGVRVYIANVADATTGVGIINGSRIFSGYDAAIANSISCSAWFRSSGDTGWYNSTHAGGIYMIAADYVRIYNKPLAINTANGTSSQLRLEGVSNSIEFSDTDGAVNTWIHHNSGNLGFLMNNAFGWAFYRDSANNMQAMGNITAYASDRRLKTNIKDIEMARVNKFFDTVRIRTFDWDGDAIRKKKLSIEVLKDQDGAIAQEMREAYPDAVTVNEAHNPVKTKDNPNPEKHDILTIKWEKLIPLLVAKVQEQDKRIAELEALNSSITGKSS